MSDRYNAGAIRFHWIMALLVVIVGVAARAADGGSTSCGEKMPACGGG